MNYSDIRPKLNTFDLILFHGTSIVSKVVSGLSKTTIGDFAPYYTHCGMVIRSSDFPVSHPLYSPLQKIYIFESTMSGFGHLPHGKFIENGKIVKKNFIGVQIRNLDKVVGEYSRNQDNAIGWAPMTSEGRSKLEERNGIRFSEKFCSKVAEIHNSYSGVPYEFNPIRLFAIALKCMRSIRNFFFRKTTRNNSIVCSELVTLILRDLNMISKDIDAEDVLPDDFLMNPITNKTYDVDEQIPVLYDTITIIK